MKKLFCAVALLGVAFVARCAADDVSTSESGAFSLDTRAGKGAIETSGTETLRYSNLWDGDSSAKVTLAQDGVAFAEGLAGEGTYEWNALNDGTYTLTHTTCTNGVAGAVETATLVVGGRDNVSVVGWSGLYDGAAHGVSVTVSDAIPAPTVKYAVSRGGPYADEPPTQTDAGTLAVWVEVSAPGYAPSVHTATVEVAKRTVTLTSGSASKVYDATPLVAHEVAVGGDGFADGEGVSCSYTGSRFTLGTSANKFTYVLNANTKAENYTITTAYGTLTVVEGQADMDVSSTCESGVFSLDTRAGKGAIETSGTEALRFSNRWGGYASATVTLAQDGAPLAEGLEGEGAFTWNALNDGMYTLTHTTCTNGVAGAVETATFVVGGRDNVSVAGWSGLYDGAAHGVSVTVSDAIPAPTVKYAVSRGGPYADEPPTQTDAGTLAVWVEVSAPGYAPSVHTATVEVAKRTVTLTSGSASKVYDATPLVAHEVAVGGDGFADGEGVSCSYTGSRFTLGTSANKFTYVLNANTKAENYTITTAYGTLTVVEGQADMDVSSTCESGVFSLDTRAGKGAIETSGTEMLRFSNQWGGYASATVTLAQDGVPLVEGLEGEGAFTWNALNDGTYTLTHTTCTNGAAYKMETATFVVGAPPLPYVVIDLSGGTNATRYPVSCLSAVPSGGWTDEYKTTKLVMRRIEAGSFIMGGGTTPESSRVTISKPFYMGVFEVTQRQYELVMGSNPSYYKGVTRPVEYVSYNDIRGSSAEANWPASSAVDATSFLGKLRAKTGLDGFDLPTEAQWEYVCRAGTTSKYNNGGDTEDDLKTLGRYRYNQSDGLGGYTDAHTAVGSYAPNAWGLYDMHGNVSEWCLDWYNYSLSYGADPEGLSSGSYRVPRGGCWSAGAVYSASSNRDSSSSYPSGRYSDVGFRLACRIDFGLPFTDGDVSVMGWSGKYDGAAHGVSVTVADGIADATVKYASAEDGEYSAENPQFTDAGTYTVWCEISAPGYIPLTNSATVSISLRSVTLTSAGASKVYDGSPLVNDSVTVGGDGFASGEGASFAVTGSQTAVGESANSFTYALNENTKAGNYAVTTSFGTLAVTKATLGGDAGDEPGDGAVAEGGLSKFDAASTYDGLGHTIDTNALLQAFRAAMGGDVAVSYAIGTAAGRDVPVAPSGDGVDGTAQSGDSGGAGRAALPDDDAWTSLAPSFTNAGDYVVWYRVANANYEDFTHSAKVTVSPRPATLTSGDGTWTYDGLAHSNATVTADGFVDGEGVVASGFAEIVDVGTAPNSFDYAFLDGTLAANYSVACATGTLSVAAADMGGWTDAAKWSVALAGDGQKYDGTERTCRVTALSYGGFAIPSFTVTGNAATDAGDYVLTVTGAGNFAGTHSVPWSIAKRSVTLTSAGASKVYDGSPLVDGTVTVGGDGFVSGEGASFAVTGSQTAVGESANSFTYALNENTRAGNYNVSMSFGTLAVTKATIGGDAGDEPGDGAIAEGGLSKFDTSIVYDGLGHTVDTNALLQAFRAAMGGDVAVSYAEDDADAASSVPSQGLAWTAASPSFTNAGEHAVWYRVSNPNYEDFTHSAKVTVSPRPATLASGDGTWTYDGLAHSNATVVAEGFVDGEGVAASGFAEIVDAGERPNSFEYAFLDGTLAANYSVACATGTLSVAAADMGGWTDAEKWSVALAGDGEKYDGTERTCRVTALSYGGFAIPSFTVTGNAATDAGDYVLTVTGAGNFAGTHSVPWSIAKRSVTLTSAGASKVYDGSPIVNSAVSVGGDGFVSGEGASFAVTGSQTAVGESANSFAYALNENTKGRIATQVAQEILKPFWQDVNDIHLRSLLSASVCVSS